MHVTYHFAQFRHTVDMSYEIIEGERKGSQLFVHNSYIYMLKYPAKGKTYLKCSDNTCIATAIIVNGTFRAARAHIHGDNSSEIERLKLKRTLKERAAESAEPLRQIYDNVTTSSSNGWLVAFPGKLHQE